MTRLERLLKVASGGKRLLVLTHDNPDPDAIASAVGLARLVEARTPTKARAAYGGIIGRAENRAMVETLKLPIKHLGRTGLTRSDLVALVHTQPGVKNHSLPPDHRADIVIDHHPANKTPYKAAYTEIDRKAGATSTLVARHLFRANVTIEPWLATALLYGIKSDTQDLGREAGPRDVNTFLKLYSMADTKAIPRIVFAPVPRSYFRMFERAFRMAEVCGRLVVTHLGDIKIPDMVAEVADLLLRLRDCDWSAATGRYRGRLVVSLRTSKASGRAGRVIESVVGANGSAGGHGMSAGASIPIRGRGGRAARALERRVQAGLVAEIDPEGGAPERLLAP